MWRHEMVRVITVLSMTGVRPISGQYPGHVVSLDQSADHAVVDGDLVVGDAALAEGGRGEVGPGVGA